ncbi:hypothetical protein ACFE04_008323 [Oxalis oulophora]
MPVLFGEIEAKRPFRVDGRVSDLYRAALDARPHSEPRRRVFLDSFGFKMGTTDSRVDGAIASISVTRFGTRLFECYAEFRSKKRNRRNSAITKRLRVETTRRIRTNEKVGKFGLESFWRNKAAAPRRPPLAELYRARRGRRNTRYSGLRRLLESTGVRGCEYIINRRRLARVPTPYRRARTRTSRYMRARISARIGRDAEYQTNAKRTRSLCRLGTRFQVDEGWSRRVGGSVRSRFVTRRVRQSENELANRESRCGTCIFSYGYSSIDTRNTIVTRNIGTETDETGRDGTGRDGTERGIVVLGPLGAKYATVSKCAYARRQFSARRVNALRPDRYVFLDNRRVRSHLS